MSVGRRLNQLSRHPNARHPNALGLTQSAQGKRLNLPAYSITGLTDSMQAASLVERQKDPSTRRNHLISLQARGKTIAPGAHETIAQGNNRLLVGQTTAERQVFTETLEKFV